MSAAAIGDWRELAECATGGYDPEMWHPWPGGFVAMTTAISICRRCPVRAECLAVALATPRDDDHGIWGGLTANQRTRIRTAGDELEASAGSTRRLRALAHNGWTLRAIAETISSLAEVKCSAEKLRGIRDGHAPFVAFELAVYIATAYDLLSARVAHGRWPDSTRARAFDECWHSVEDWEGLDIDDPHALPHLAA